MQLLSDFFRTVDRTLPPTLLVHFLANATYQSGMTLEALNELPTPRFIQVCLWLRVCLHMLAYT